MNRHVLSAIAIIWLTLCAVVSPVHAGLLNRADVDKLLDSQYVVGEVQADMPVYPLFEKKFVYRDVQARAQRLCIRVHRL